MNKETLEGTHDILAAKTAEPSSPLTNSLEAQTVNEEKNYHWISPEFSFWTTSYLPLRRAQEA